MKKVLLTMEPEFIETKSSKEQKSIPNGISKLPSLSILSNLQNTTELDISNKGMESIDESVILPQSLQNINLSHNKLTSIPKSVEGLKDLKVLDVSHNNIEYFNDTPSFCHVLEVLKISNNRLRSPPQWVWMESPKNLSKLDISCNVHISNSLMSDSKILQCNALVAHVILYNCRLGKHLSFLGTFPKTTHLELGTPDWSCYAANHLQDIPCQGLDQCCDIEKLDLSNTHIYNMSPSITIYKNLKEINLSYNNLNGLPGEFCDLENLEICLLSFNNIMYLPDEIVKLTKLTILCLDVNDLCMIPHNITELVNLKTLDLYDNNIYEYPEGIKDLPELDLAQNYFEEPEDEHYLAKREKLRLKKIDRQNGRKYEMERPESMYSPNTSDDEESVKSIKDAQSEDVTGVHLASSPEDWDSDACWVPQSCKFVPPTHTTYWLNFVKTKMAEGNLCPMDLHTVPVAEKVKYEKKCFPIEQYESDGQFDDFSEDDS